MRTKNEFVEKREVLGMDENEFVEKIPLSASLKWYFAQRLGNFLTVPIFIWLIYCLVIAIFGGIIQWVALVRATSAVFGILITILNSFLWILPFLPPVLYYSLLKNIPGLWLRRDASKKVKIGFSIGIFIIFSLLAFLTFHMNVKLIAWIADRNPEAAYKAGVIGSKREKYERHAPKTSSAPSSERIINKQDADYIFSLNRAGWEIYAQRMVHPDGWKVRFAHHDTGTSVMAFDPNTGMGLSVQPLYNNDNSPPTVLIVGSYYSLGFLPAFTDDFKRSLEEEASEDLGPVYSVSASYSKMPPFEAIELAIKKK